MVSDDITEYLGPGDLVFLAPGREHFLIGENIAGGNGNPAQTFLLCGYCSFNSAFGAVFNELFPDIVVMRDEQLQSAAWLKTLLDQISHEHLSNTPGTDVVVNRLTEVLIVELVRLNFGRREATPLLQALSDRYIGKALQRLHQASDKPWSLEALAAEVGMSRAGLAKRFKDLVGQTMFSYLTTLRMQQASDLLTDSDLPLYAVAQQVGYESDLAFTRTFKKVVGMSPTAFRKKDRSS